VEYTEGSGTESRVVNLTAHNLEVADLSRAEAV
jgi:hypothetical protein